MAKELGQFFMIGFQGKSPDDELRHIIRTCRPSGIILFKRNLESPAQIRSLTDELQSILPGHPLLVSVDHEGGRVWRLPEEFTLFPEAECLGRSGSESLARSVARVMSMELSAVGIHCNFSPVLDLNTNPLNPVIGDRSMGTDPLMVARLARAMLLGFRDYGITGCGKHFPGHGDTDLDSHLELPSVRHPRERIHAVELAPYRWLLGDSRSPLDLIMTAHLLVHHLDPQYPATLSPKILRGLLRRTLGFRGLIVTDDMEMGAITRNYSPQEAALLALQAGADLLLYCHTPSLLPLCMETLGRSLDAGEIPFRRLRRSSIRIQSFKNRLLRRFPNGRVRTALYSRIGSPKHRAVADRLLSFR
jgi:beta-N-acetylhexosaminidase